MDADSGGKAVVAAVPEDGAGVVNDDNPEDVVDADSGGKAGGKATSYKLTLFTGLTYN